ncbi:L-plastin [Aphelenchoides fujianensis]|nr:L-plastin [Aphelenchoides fujianensis]
MPTFRQVAELTEAFPTLTKNGSGHISFKDLPAALKLCGVDIPGYQLRERLRKYGDPKSLDYHQRNQWKKRIGSVTGAYQVQSAAEVGADEIVHTIRVEEELAFSNWINSNLSNDPDLKHLLPVETGDDLYTKIQDGLVICKLIDFSVPGTINFERVRGRKTHQKRREALRGAETIGITIVDTNDHAIFFHQEALLGLLWEIVRVSFLLLFVSCLIACEFRSACSARSTSSTCPASFRLLREGETLDELRRLTPKQILILWVNYHLERAGAGRQLSNFTSDVTDSEIYTRLLHSIAPVERGVSLAPLSVLGNVQRATSMLNEANKIGCREFVSANDVAQGNYKLNLAFVANLFNKYPNLPEPDAEEKKKLDVIRWTNGFENDPCWLWCYGVGGAIVLVFVCWVCFCRLQEVARVVAPNGPINSTSSSRTEPLASARKRTNKLRL